MEKAKKLFCVIDEDKRKERSRPNPDLEAVKEFTTEELAEATVKLANNKSPGMDGIPNEVLKVAMVTCPGVILKIMNSILKE